VQFYVLSPVSDKVTAVTGTYARTCADARTPGSGRDTLRPGLFVMSGTPATRHVEMSVPALSPNRYYCFTFTLTLKPDEAKLRRIVAEQLDLHLREVYGDEASISQQEAFDGFRADILSGIRDAARELQLETGLSSLKLTVPPDSFFADPAPRPSSPSSAVAATPDDVRPRITQRQGARSNTINDRESREFDELVQMQLNKADQIKNFRGSASRAANALATLRAKPEFGVIVTQLRVNSAQPLVRLQMPTDNAIRFAVPADKDADRVLGIAPGQSAAAVDVDKVWGASELSSRVSNLDTIIGQIDAFSTIVVNLGDPLSAPFRDAAGLGPTPVQGVANSNIPITPAQFRDVANQVKSVYGALVAARSELAIVQGLLTSRSAAINAAAARVTADIVQVIDIDGDTTADWETRARSYVSADVGVAWSQPIQTFFFYVGANFYLGPVNKKAPLRWSEPGNLRKRFAFLAGVPINSFDQAQTQTSLTAGNVTLTGVLGSRPILLGAGLRLSDLIRVTSGAVLFRVKSPNPLITAERLDYAWFLAFSIDWDLKGMFAELQPKTGSSVSFHR